MKYLIEFGMKSYAVSNMSQEKKKKGWNFYLKLSFFSEVIL